MVSGKKRARKCGVMSAKDAFQEKKIYLSNNAMERHIQIINEKCSLDIAVSLRGKFKTK